MALFLTWDEWVFLREDNARKRRVRAALAGTGTPLPGSAAACPSTNVRAMKSAAKTGEVKKLPYDENDGQAPDYSFDRWIQKAKEFGDDVNRMRTNVDQEDKKTEKKKKDIEKKSDDDKKVKAKPSVKDKDENKEGPSEKDKDETWKKLRAIHQKALSKVGLKDAGTSEEE